MKVSRFVISKQGEKPTVKRILLAVAAALLFVNTFAIPMAHADGGGVGGTNCGGNSVCKP